LTHEQQNVVPQFAHVMCGAAFTMLCARSLSTTIDPHFEQVSMFKPQQKYRHKTFKSYFKSLFLPSTLILGLGKRFKRKKRRKLSFV